MHIKPIDVRGHTESHPPCLANLVPVRKHGPVGIHQFSNGSSQIAAGNLHIDLLFQITKASAKSGLTKLLPALTFKKSIANDAAIAFPLNHGPAGAAAGNRSAKIVKNDFSIE
jgi:hypothetical protein